MTRAALVSGRVLLAIVAAVTVVTTDTACSRPVGDGGAQDVQVSVALEPDPPGVGAASVEVRVASPDGRPLAGATIDLEANMQHAGMTPVFASLAETAPGRHAGKLEFTMSGDWFLLIHGTLPDGREFERQVDVKGVRPR